jgi:hypothetical protein
MRRPIGLETKHAGAPLRVAIANTVMRPEIVDIHHLEAIEIFRSPSHGPTLYLAVLEPVCKGASESS